MYRFRRFPAVLRCWLALSLALAPVLPSLAGTAAMPMPVAAVADAHADHVMHGDHGNAQSGCQSNQNCHGLCCASCAQCTGIATITGNTLSFLPPVLTPREVRLLSFVYPPLRERPPRVLLA